MDGIKGERSEDRAIRPKIIINMVSIPAVTRSKK